MQYCHDKRCASNTLYASQRKKCSVCGDWFCLKHIISRLSDEQGSEPVYICYNCYDFPYWIRKSCEIANPSTIDSSDIECIELKSILTK